MYSTREAALQAGIAFRTLNLWIAKGKVKAPKLRKMGPVRARIWSERDVARLKEDVPKVRFKSKNGRKKKGKKTKLK